MPGSEMAWTEYARVSGEIAAPLEVVWRAVSGFGGAERWIAGALSSVLEGEGEGAVRTIQLADRSVRERLDRVDSARHSITYSILPPHSLPAESVRGTIELTAASAASTKVTWFSEAARIDGDAALLRARIEAFYSASIDGLRRLVSQGWTGVSGA